MNRAPQESTEGPQWHLMPLTPEYLEAEHGGYVAALETALKDNKIRNIALSGNYGVGKSSILRELGKRLDGRVVELSLSTLAAIEGESLDDSVPIQATTPTNRIQQEIVKQLLYREVPGKMPGSRFERIERFRWKRELGVAALAGLLVAVVFLLTEWSAQIATVFRPLLDAGLWIHLIVLLIATGTMFGIRWLMYGRIRIKQFSAGSATVTLDDKSVSYFDQYLDEIVHFFEVSKKQDVVIFEDIDRFNNSHIFETLRSLNTLLNGAPQIKKEIRFIYAIKDSIFDKIGLEEQGRPLDRSILETDDPALAETIRANRTKFFDLVIPVVPFITHRSARNLATQLLGEVQHTVDPKLLDLAARFVPDMRLLKNVRNEFIVFRDRIFSGDGEKLDLSETDLFAMMLYKSTHLTDFEKIRLGTSNLDVLYRLSRELVTENIKRIEGERRALQSRLARVDGATARSDVLGQMLIAHVDRTVKSANMRDPYNDATFMFGSAEQTKESLRSGTFWREFASANDSDAMLKWTAYYNNSSLTFSRESLAASLGDPLNAEAWDEVAREELREEIAEKSDAIKFLRRADMGELIQRSEFLVDYRDEAQSLDAVAQRLLATGLAYRLVRAGFIDRNFTLYTSTFHGDCVSAASTNFIIRHVERDLMDVQFELTPDDVDMVLRERGLQALKEPALYNIAILDRLLDSQPDLADIMIRSLVGLGDAQRQFLQAYLDAGCHRKDLIARLTPILSRVLVYLVSEAELNELSRLELVDAALAHLPSSKQRTDSAVVNYLRTHYAEFSTLTSDQTTTEQAERVAVLFADAGIYVVRLEPLVAQVRLSFVSRNLYEVTRENLVLAIDNVEPIALDVIRTANETVYEYCLSNLTAYLDAIDEGNYSTVDTVQQFAGILEDVLERGDDTHLDRVVAGSSMVCVIEDLNDVASSAWHVLAKHQRFPVTFDNVTRYVESVGSIDQALAGMLAKRGTISKTDTAEEDAKESLAKTVLSANTVLPSADLRARLVESLELAKYLDVDELPPEKSALFACLLKRNIIADDALSYERLAATDWPTREAFICASESFHRYVAPDHVKSDIAPLLMSTKINDAVKQAILTRADEFVEDAGMAGLIQLAEYAIQQKKSVSEDVVLRMARGRVPAQHVVMLLEPHFSAITKERLFVVLQSLGETYSQLTSVGRGKPKLPNTPADRALLERLKRDEIVSSYDEEESYIKVNKRYK